MDSTPNPTNAHSDLFGGRVPIVIGITGHRDLGAMEEAIAAAVTAQCKKLRRAYPDTPFLLLTGLAEGADRLVADVALSELKDARLCAVLPLPPKEYAGDFATSASRQEFAELLAKAVCRVDMFDEADAAKWNAPGKGRDEQYALVGGMIAEQAQILIAVWDGEGPRGIGGTAQVVNWFSQGFPPKRYSAYRDNITPLDPSEPGLLIHIHSHSAAVEVAEVGAEPSPHKPLDAEVRRSNIRKVLKCTERYNRDVKRKAARIEGNKPVLVPLPEGAAPEAAAIYRAADGLAVHYAKLVRAADYLVYGLALVAVFFFNMINNWPVASWAYFVTTAMMALGLLLLWGRSLDARFIEYRGLAEAARVLFFLRLAGVRTPVWLRFMSKHAGPVRWVRQTIRALEFCDDRRAGGSGVPEGVALATKNWVGGQIEYHQGAMGAHWRRYRIWQMIARASFLLSFVIAVALSVAAFWSMETGHAWKWPNAQIPGWPISFEVATDRLQLVLGLLAAAGIAVRAFLARRAHLELAKQFAATRQLFERAGRNLKEAETLGAEADWTAREIIESLGQHALLEGAEWVWVRHSRPFEMPS